jgi:hypothetical protein
MHAAVSDFVSALSAEERCLVCTEPYATVDQRLCADCGTAICPDCAHLKPDTSWTCVPCEEQRAAARAPSIAAKQGTSLSTAPAVRSDRGPVAALLTRALSLVGALFAATRPLTRALHGRYVDIAERLQTQLRDHLARVQSSWRRDSRAMMRAATDLADAGLTKLRLRVAEFVLSIRDVPVREHVAGVLLGTAILIAVARAPRRDLR